MASQSQAYNSQDSDADSLFDNSEQQQQQHDTIATVPVSFDPAPQHRYQTTSTQPDTFVTQPTQPWHTPSRRQPAQTDMNGSRVLSSPSVQVAASSPANEATKPTSTGPATSSLGQGALNRGISAMAPPGTNFRPPTYTQPMTQQTLDFSDNEAQLEDSSDEERRRRNDIKPSVFIKGGRPLGPGRIEESPQSQPRAFGDLASKFSFNNNNTASSPSKRPAPDDMASAYGASHRQKKQRQAGPAPAQPVEVAMSLNDVHDYSMRQKVKRVQQTLPAPSVRRIYNMLVKKKGNESDTMEALVAEDEQADEAAATSQAPIDLTGQSDDELSQPRRPSAKQLIGKSMPIANKYSSLHSVLRDELSEGSSPPPAASNRPQAKQQVSSGKSIVDRYSNVASNESSSKPRKRLVRGTGQAPRSPQYPVSPAHLPSKAEVRKARAVVSDDDDDSGVGGDEEEDVTSPETEEKLLAFINEASSLALQDLSGQSEEIIKDVIAKRPYKDLEQIRAVWIETHSTSKNGKSRVIRRAIGDKLVDACMNMWVGYEAVDLLVSRCEQLGKPIAAEMKQWGFDAFGSANGELNATSLDVSSAHDSGIGTPSSSASHEDVEPRPKVPTRKPVLRQPKSMNERLALKDYQIAGMNWLALLYSHGLSGILADDMGLGKTCQVIAFLAHLKEQGITHGPHLVVAPGSTLENWIREIQRFCPSLRLEPYYGKHTERPSQQLKIQDSIKNIDIVVTTYDMATKPMDNKFLRRLPFEVCIYDEAHKLKNSTSAVYKSLMRIQARSMRLLLTGTPLQNNLMELGSMLAFLMPDLFGAKEQELTNVFKHRAKVEKSKDQPTTESDAKRDHDALLSAARITRARSMLTPFILRRKKHQVLKQLPRKTNIVERCDLTGMQASLYQEIEDNLARVLEQRKLDALQDAAKKKQATEKIRDFNKAPEIKEDNATKTNILMDLRKAAIHPLLFRRHYDDKTLRKMSKKYARVKPDEDINEQFVFEDFSQMSDMELHRFCTDTEPSFRKEFALKNEPWMDSAKVQSLLKLLKSHAENGHRTLIFSQFTRVMDILEAVFETTSTRFYRLDGQTKMETRQDMIDLFTQEAERSSVARSSTPASTTESSELSSVKDASEQEEDDDDDDDDIKVTSHRRTDKSPTKSSSSPNKAKSDSPAAIFMLSTRAGGQGINLTAADRVIIFDSGFNPHDDVQAENRAHRVGQTREVEVVKLVARGTIEEDILRLGVRKVKLDELVAGASANAEGGAMGSGGVDGEGQGEGEGSAEASGKEDGDDTQTVRESEGQSLVEKMLAERLSAAGKNQEKRKETADEDAEKEEKTSDDAPLKKDTTADVSKAFMKRLVNAGLDMSAATAPIVLGGEVGVIRAGED